MSTSGQSPAGLRRIAHREPGEALSRFVTGSLRAQ